MRHTSIKITFYAAGYIKTQFKEVAITKVSLIS